MANQGRLFTVMTSLMAAMTAGAMILMALSGKPIRPLPGGGLIGMQRTSLGSSVNSLAPVHTVLRTDMGINSQKWSVIKISYVTNYKGLGVEQNGPTGQLAMSYHFVIGDGYYGQNGEIFPTHRWKSQQDCVLPADYPSAGRTIRVCMVRKSSNLGATGSQSIQLEELIKKLRSFLGDNVMVRWEQS